MPLSIAVLDPTKGPTVDDLKKVYALHTESVRYQEDSAFKSLIDGKLVAIASVMSERHHMLRGGGDVFHLPDHTPLNSTASLLFLDMKKVK